MGNEKASEPPMAHPGIPAELPVTTVPSASIETPTTPLDVDEDTSKVRTKLRLYSILTALNVRHTSTETCDFKTAD